MSRIVIHRNKKLGQIAKKKDDIAKHLEAGNEVNAKIWVSTQTIDLRIVKFLIKYSPPPRHIYLEKVND